MKRIGLTQRVEVVPGYEERRDCLDQRWTTLLLSLGYCPVPLANLVDQVDLYVETLQIDGLILTGGNDLCQAQGGSNMAPDRDRFEHRLINVCIERHLPILGVCRGIQILNEHYGGSITPIENHVNQRHRVSLSSQSLQGLPRSAETNSFHGFGITESGQSHELKAVGWADDGTIEAVAHETLPLFGVMWHPEREETLADHDYLIIRSLFGGGSA